MMGHKSQRRRISIRPPALLVINAIVVPPASQKQPRKKIVSSKAKPSHGPRKPSVRSSAPLDIWSIPAALRLQPRNAVVPSNANPMPVVPADIVTVARLRPEASADGTHTRLLVNEAVQADSNGRMLPFNAKLIAVEQAGTPHTNGGDNIDPDGADPDDGYQICNRIPNKRLSLDLPWLACSDLGVLHIYLKHYIEVQITAGRGICVFNDIHGSSAAVNGASAAFTADGSYEYKQSGNKLEIRAPHRRCIRSTPWMTEFFKSGEGFILPVDIANTIVKAPNPPDESVRPFPEALTTQVLVSSTKFTRENAYRSKHALENSCIETACIGHDPSSGRFDFHINGVSVHQDENGAAVVTCGDKLLKICPLSGDMALSNQGVYMEYTKKPETLEIVHRHGHIYMEDRSYCVSNWTMEAGFRGNRAFFHCAPKPPRRGS
ncbi:hypothetical protein CAPTEDRAFT_221533 [Capitella teleta]|uniref:Uncharacterized protein n=1 Tax=Capitella teleta TaxID=283909 RepID=R7T7V1_CAPTE|nr:hypothetical protein CAPTEDRAFT_221533 [Capitella teleta]|eukprot:ELT89690.1 hypothetical protein CAPTEDRAFT_221533 [Capitella teleta]